jgi:hypothetical protein
MIHALSGADTVLSCGRFHGAIFAALAGVKVAVCMDVLPEKMKQLAGYGIPLIADEAAVVDVDSLRLKVEDALEGLFERLDQ